MNAKRRGLVWPAAVGIFAAVVLLLSIAYLMERSTGSTDLDGPIRTVEELLGLGGKQEAPVYFNGRQYRKNTDIKAYLFMGVD